MLTRRIFPFAVAFSLVTSGAIVAAPADDATATAFVSKIYGAYKGRDGKGVLLDNEAQIRRYFEPSLAALIIKDRKAAAKRSDVPALDGDPFIDAQDFEISDIDIAVSDVPPDKAAATVNFKNLNEPVKVVLNLVKVKNEWRIADILYTRDGKPETLRELFKH